MMKMKVGILLMAVAETANTEVVLANDDASETQKLQMRLQVHRYPWLLPYHGILYLLLNLPVL